MAWSITSIGTANVASGGGNPAITVGAGGVPAGSIIVVGTNESSNVAPGGSIADSASNSYTSIVNKSNNNAQNQGFGAVFYAKNAAALVQNNTITYTKAATGAAAITAAYLTGGDTAAPLDTAVTASASGSSSAPSVISGTPAVSGEMFVSFVSASTVVTVTQDSGNGWATPPNAVATNATAAGGNQTNAGTGTKTFAPTLSMGTSWAAFVVGFKLASAASGAMFMLLR